MLKFSAQVTEGGTCRNFAYYSMLIILYRRPKGGGHGTIAPPKYAAGYEYVVCTEALTKVFRLE